MRTVEVKILDIGCVIKCAVKIPQLLPGDRVLVKSNGIIFAGIVASDAAVFTDAVFTDGIPAAQPPPDSFIIRKLFPFETGDKFIRYKIEDEGLDFCKKNVAELGLSMKLLLVKYIASDNRLVFYYSAEERVDFRELVKILASRFHLRIEMRQINIRDECKILGGIGVCGRVCCCASIVNEMNAVTSKITKLQCQNTSKFVGYCGRLLCCLAFDPPLIDAEGECNCEKIATAEAAAEDGGDNLTENSHNSNGFDDGLNNEEKEKL